MTTQRQSVGATQPTSTRQAVESSIETSKSDKTSTWEKLATPSVTRWKSDVNVTGRPANTNK